MIVRSLSPNRYLRELKLMNETLFKIAKKNLGSFFLDNTERRTKLRATDLRYRQTVYCM